MTTKTDPNPTAKQEATATLKKPHRHRGELKEPGETITGRPETIAKLKDKGIV